MCFCSYVLHFNFPCIYSLNQMRLVSERANHHALKAALSAHMNKCTDFSIALVSGEQPKLEGVHTRPLFNCNQ